MLSTIGYTNVHVPIECRHTNTAAQECSMQRYPGFVVKVCALPTKNFGRSDIDPDEQVPVIALA
jgi:hypothetical protein